MPSYLPNFDAIHSLFEQGKTQGEIRAACRPESWQVETLDLALAIVSDDRAAFKQALGALRTSPRLRIEKTEQIELGQAMTYAERPDREFYARELLSRLSVSTLQQGINWAASSGNVYVFHVYLSHAKKSRVDFKQVLDVVLENHTQWDAPEATAHLAIFEQLLPLINLEKFARQHPYEKDVLSQLINDNYPPSFVSALLVNSPPKESSGWALLSLSDDDYQVHAPKLAANLRHMKPHFADMVRLKCLDILTSSGGTGPAHDRALDIWGQLKKHAPKPADLRVLEAAVNGQHVEQIHDLLPHYKRSKDVDFPALNERVHSLIDLPSAVTSSRRRVLRR